MTAFLRNQWYVIGWSRDIGSEAYARTVCNEPIVAWRKADGSLTAMRDACPHRLLPLSMGLREGDNLRCRYHGLLVGPDGRACEMPVKSQKPNRSICSPLYPIVEQHGFVWVWIGDADKADPALIPDFWMCDGPEWVADGGTYHVRCDYRLLIDNLMDLTHETYVHATTIGQGELMESDIRTHVDGDDIRVERWMPDIPPAPVWKDRANGGNVDRWQICHFVMPANVLIDVGVAPTSEHATLEDHPVHSFVINAMTPETETTTWYYWGAARNVHVDDPVRTERTKAIQAKVFAEDIEILEAQQRSIELNPDLKLAAFNIDSGGIRARLAIDRAIKRQS